MKSLVVILHNIRSLHNVGSIFRTSDGAGVDKIYLCGYTPAPKDKLNRTPSALAKTALGAEENIPWEKVGRLPELISKLKKRNYKIWAVEQDQKSTPYFKAKPALGDRIALLLGPEIGGLDKRVLDKCDRVLEIPMRGAMVRHARHPAHSRIGKESLNVSVAFGVAVYQLTTDDKKLINRAQNGETSGLSRT
ncbi:MAG: TrmH family RNA methyltransferase [Candidatus Liptonbacteria bacterium]